MIEQVPNVSVVVRDGIAYVQYPGYYDTVSGISHEGDVERVDDYIAKCYDKAQACCDELQQFIHICDCRFIDDRVGFGQRQRDAKAKKNRELIQKFQSLLRQMLDSKDEKELNQAYQRLTQMVDKMEGPFSAMEEQRRRKVLAYLDGFNGLVKSSDDYYVRSDIMPSGMNIEKFRERFANSHGLIDGNILKEYINTMYTSLHQQYYIKKRVDRLGDSHKDLVPDEVMIEKDMLEEDVLTNGDTVQDENLIEKDISEEDTLTIEDVRRMRREVNASFMELVERKNAIIAKRDELLKEKFSIQVGADASGLFETKKVQVPVYREHPNLTDGDVLFYQEESRFVNGSDEEREEHRRRIHVIEQEIKKLEEQIKVLTESIQEEEKKAESLRTTEREMAFAEVDARIFGMSKIQRAVAKLSGKMEMVEMMRSQSDLSEQEIDRVRGMFL